MELDGEGEIDEEVGDSLDGKIAGDGGSCNVSEVDSIVNSYDRYHLRVVICVYG